MIGKSSTKYALMKFSNHARPHTWLCAVPGMDLENLRRNWQSLELSMSLWKYFKKGNCNLSDPNGALAQSASSSLPTRKLTALFITFINFIEMGMNALKGYEC